MSFGKLSPEQRRAVKPFVRDRVVYDLGSGDDLELAAVLVGMRAKEVVAVDTYPTPWHTTTGYGPKGTAFERVRYVRNYFENVTDPIRTAFVSWPSNRPSEGLLRLVKRASLVIYLGNCMDGTMCGSRELYGHLHGRKVLVHLPEKKNTLVVYGAKGPPRDLLPEELAGIDHSRIYRSEEEYRRVRDHELVP